MSSQHKKPDLSHEEPSASKKRKTNTEDETKPSQETRHSQNAIPSASTEQKPTEKNSKNNKTLKKKPVNDN
jgi:hypothetical protein